MTTMNYLSRNETFDAILEALEEEVVPQVISQKQMEFVADAIITKLEDLGVIFIIDDDDDYDDDDENGDEVLEQDD